MNEEQAGGMTFKCKHGVLGTENYCRGCLGRPRYYSDGERGFDKVTDATAYNRMKHSEGLPPGVCNEEPLEWTGITWADAELTRLRELATRWYLADGSFVTLTEEEVIRRRKEAAKTLARVEDAEEVTDIIYRCGYPSIKTKARARTIAVSLIAHLKEGK